jgi:hypothetical protein
MPRTKSPIFASAFVDEYLFALWKHRWLSIKHERGTTKPCSPEYS